MSLFQNEISVIKLFGSQQASFCTDLYYFACVARVMHHTSIPSSYHNCSLFYLNSLTSHHCSVLIIFHILTSKPKSHSYISCSVLSQFAKSAFLPQSALMGNLPFFYSFSLRIFQISQMSCSSLCLILFILFCCPPRLLLLSKLCLLSDLH